MVGGVPAEAHGPSWRNGFRVQCLLPSNIAVPDAKSQDEIVTGAL